MTITEVSAKYDISADTLRYYERVGLIPGVRRKESGVRDYSEQDCGWVEFAKCMRGAGINVEALIEYVALFQLGDVTSPARKQILIEQRRQLAKKVEEMQATLLRLDKKIERYEAYVKPAEERLRGEH